MLMRKIIFPLMLLFLFLMGKNEAYAQYYLTKDGVEIPYLFMEGTRVYDEHRMIPDEQLLILLSDVDGVNYGERFLKARRSFKAGVGLTVTGGILGVAGYGYRYFSGDNIGTYVALGGLTLAVIGVPTFCVSRGKMHTFIRRYNNMNRRNFEVKAGPQQHGIGLALNF